MDYRTGTGGDTRGYTGGYGGYNPPTGIPSVPPPMTPPPPPRQMPNLPNRARRNRKWTAQDQGGALDHVWGGATTGIV